MASINCCKLLLLTLALLAHTQFSVAFTPCYYHVSASRGCSDSTNAMTQLSMGLFDGIAKAFSNADFKAEDQRVGASHILIKGDDTDQVMATIKNVMGEIQARAGEGDEPLSQVFSELARRESQCPSKDKGGDLGMFAQGAMVKEFDQALFPDDATLEPQPGNIIGPVITDFGAHIIFVTKRDVNRDQVEEKLARND